jgi:RNA polymerase sigma-B factor
MLAILRVVSRFDSDKGASFATFADRTVEGECKRYLRDRTWLVRPPRRLHDAHLRVRRVADELTTRLSRSPTVAELAEDLGWDEEEILEALEVAECRHGADPEGQQDPRRPWFEPAAEDQGLEGCTEKLWLERALQRVDPETRELLVLRFFGGRSQADLAGRYGVSQSYMSRMLRMGLQRLREAGGVEALEFR